MEEIESSNVGINVLAVTRINIFTQTRCTRVALTTLYSDNNLRGDRTFRVDNDLKYISRKVEQFLQVNKG